MKNRSKYSLIFWSAIALIIYSQPLYAANKGVKQQSKEQGSLHPFTLIGPKGWHLIDDPSQLPIRVKVVYIGKGKGAFTPSLNLAIEETDLDVENYYTLAKNYHNSQADTRCSYLGRMQTKGGEAEFLQIDRKTSFGDVRFLQAILVKNRSAYVITATALLEEYGTFYSSFFNTIQSFALKTEEATTLPTEKIR